MFKAISSSILSTCILALFPACGPTQPSAHKETVLAKIADKTISMSEFVRRAEYTIRPAYCRGDNYVHRKIVLNSLIAEKLLALEVGANSALHENEEYMDYLNGRKEQAMRQYLFHRVAYEGVKPDRNQVSAAYAVAGRTYRIAYFTLKDSVELAFARSQLRDSGPSFEATYLALGGSDQPPHREISRVASENPDLLDSLYSTIRQKGDIFGPVGGDSEHYIFVKILGWTDRIAISDHEQRRRLDDTVEWLRQRQASRIFEGFVANLMQGKRIEFMPLTFRRLVELVGPHYIKSTGERKEAIRASIWREDIDDLDLESLGSAVDEIKDLPLFRIDEEIWTVQTFEAAMRRHPLIFRKRKISKADFAEQFKLAIVDLVRDEFLNREAYRRGYDETSVVQSDFAMWRDNFYSLYQQNKVLKSAGIAGDFSKNHPEIIENVLNPYVESLQTKYNNEIQINMEVFEKITLTRIDMVALQRNAPFPIVVPGFPILTTDNLLDYGRKMSAAP